MELIVAERVGFEPTEVLPSLVFKTSTINRSDTSPHADSDTADPGSYDTPALIMIGDPSEIRTPDTLIKSQVLYRLS